MSNTFLLVRSKFTVSRINESCLLTGTDLPKEVENAPCHVQLIGRRLKDELLMEQVKVVDSVLAG